MILPVEICCMTQGTQTGAQWQSRGVGWGGRWEGGSRGRGHMYTYGWFMLMYGRNQHKIIKQLSSIKNKMKRKQTRDWEKIKTDETRDWKKVILV